MLVFFIQFTNSLESGSTPQLFKSQFNINLAATNIIPFNEPVLALYMGAIGKRFFASNDRSEPLAISFHQ